MKIGYACTPVTTNARTNRRILLKDFSKDKFLSITKQNLDDLQKILESILVLQKKSFQNA